MTKLKDLACYIRSKNAGPFWLTIDIFCDREEEYRTLKKAENLAPEQIAQRFRVAKSSVRIFYLDQLQAVKISFPRPLVQGDMAEVDMHAGQQYVRLLDLYIEEQ